MERTELFQKIAQGELGRLYLFFGEESYVAEKALKQLQEKFLANVEEGVNLIVFDGAECTAQEVAEQCETVSFFAQEKMIVVLDSPWLGGKEDSAACDCLEELFRGIGQDVVLVFWNKTEVKKKSKLYSLVKKYGEIVEFTKVTGSELQAWMRRELAAYGKKIAPEELRFLEEYCETGLNHLSNELNKLALGTAGEQISQKDILACVTPGRDYNIYRIADYVLQGDAKNALALLELLLTHKEEPVYILSILARQIRNAAAVLQLSKKKVPRAEIAQMLQVKDFVVEKMQRSNSSLREESLQKATELLLAADTALKSRNQDALTLETLVIRLCRLLKGDAVKSRTGRG